MAQTGYTPIQLYYSSTTTNAPTAGNLAGGELAINITDGKLFYKDNANAVQVIGWKVVPATAGGTGQTSYAVGDLLYADTTTTLAKLADVATGNALISGGVGVAPSWGKIGLTTHVSGTLPTANGGTNLTAFTANGVVYASSTSALATGSALTYNGTTFQHTGAANFATSTGSVGIGTSSPSARLGIEIPNYTSSSTNGMIRFQNPDVAADSCVQSYYVTGTGSDVYIGSNSFVNTSGSTARFSGSYASSGIYIGRNGNINFLTNTSAGDPQNRMSLDSSGIVTMSAYGAGAATFSAAGVISSVSDETWKIKDGVPVDTDAMLKKLEPGYWYYNDEKKEIFGADRQLGFYAQNVNAAIGPEAAPIPETITTKNQDGSETTVTKPWGYYDRSVLAITVMSLQKALATIETLTARITALEAQ